MTAIARLTPSGGALGADDAREPTTTARPITHSPRTQARPWGLRWWWHSNCARASAAIFRCRCLFRARSPGAICCAWSSVTILVFMARAATTPAQQVCTDGMANVGVPPLKTDVGNRASREGTQVRRECSLSHRMACCCFHHRPRYPTQISLLSIEGGQCNLAALCSLARQTDGDVNICHPLEIVRTVRTLAQVRLDDANASPHFNGVNVSHCTQAARGRVNAPDTLKIQTSRQVVPSTTWRAAHDGSWSSYHGSSLVTATVCCTHCRCDNCRTRTHTHTRILGR